MSVNINHKNKTKSQKSSNSLDLCDVSEGSVPVSEQLCLLVIIHTNVEVVKCARVEVVNLFCNIEDVAHSVRTK